MYASSSGKIAQAHLSLGCSPSNTVNSEIFANSVKKLRLAYDLPAAVNDKVSLPFRKDFIFKKVCIWEVFLKIKLVTISKFTVSTKVSRAGLYVLIG